MADELKQKARRWQFTWNNYTEANLATLKELSAEKVDYLVFGHELAPEKNTPHLQGYVEFKTPIAGSAVKGRLDPVKKAKSTIHVEKCEGSRKQNIEYVRKNESKDPAYLDENGKPLITELSFVEKSQGQRSDWQIYYEFLLNNPDFDKFAEQYPNIAVKYHGGIEKVIRGIKNKQMIDKVRKNYEGAELREWQKELIAEIQKPADDRKVIWYHDDVGNSGKTWISKLMFVNHGAAYFTNSKTADITYAYQGEPIVIFDFSRSNEESINYGVIETVKNGIMFSGKYEARTKMFACPHVIIMANFAPNMSKLSMDRWDVRKPLLDKGIKLEVSPGGNTDDMSSEPQDKNILENL